MATGVTTEWDDLQVKMGNWLPREKGPTTEEVFQVNQEIAENYNPIENKTAKELDDMCEEDPDLEEDPIMEEYR